MESIRMVIDWVNNLLWGKNILVVMLIGTALYFTVRTNFMQFRLFGDIIRILKDNKTNDKDGVSSLETFFLGTACRVGAGNISGVVAAVSIGGPGALFWMWLVALLGASTSFVESSLAVIYRTKIKDGVYKGGTPWIIEKRLNMRWLGAIYVIASIICYVGVIQVMSNSVTESILSAYGNGINSFISSIGVANILGSRADVKFISIILSLIVVYIIFGKGKKDAIISALNKIVPIMAILYLIVVAYVIITNITGIPHMITNIFYQAFGGKEFLGGAIGGVIMQGVRRGLFSNEAGSGNSNYAAAIVDIEDPAKQGMVQALGVFVDTLVVCSATAFVILLADADKVAGFSGMTLFQEAMKTHVGWIGIPFTVVVLFFFSLSTILGVTYYGKNAMSFLSDKTIFDKLYHILVVWMVYVGGVEQNFFVWSLADFGLGIMTVINIICIIPISKVAIDHLKVYEVKLKENRI